MYLAKRGGLTEAEMTRIIQQFTTVERPKLQKRYDYYLGKQEIIYKQPTDVGKPCNRIVCNYVEKIVDTYEGLAVGSGVTYSNPSVDVSTVVDVLNYNDVRDEDTDLFRDGLIFGRGVEIEYLDEEAQVRFKTLDPREVIPIYENNLESRLIYAIRLWEEQLPDNLHPIYWVQVYDDRFVRTYKSCMGYHTFTLTEETPHYFGDVPLTFFSLNKEERGVADSIFTLQDAYNRLLSDAVDDWDSFCDAYLVLKGLDADADDLADMKEKRALIMDVDCSAEYLTKNVQTTEIEHLLSTCNDKIREIAACPDFSSESWGTASGIAIRYRLMALNNRCTSMLNNYRKTLQRRIELLCNILKFTHGELSWRDVQIEFSLNIPVDLTDVTNTVNALRGLVSAETLLSQIPFITDVQGELERVKAEQSNQIDLYAGTFINE